MAEQVIFMKRNLFSYMILPLAIIFLTANRFHKHNRTTEFKGQREL